jgi:hypothetical protein
MTSSPDLSTLSLSSRLHDTYDYEGNGASGGGQRPYHFSTSPPISAPSQYNPLSVVGQSPIKKPSRAALPSVLTHSLFLSLFSNLFSRSNGLIPLEIIGRYPPITIPTFHLLVALPL